MKKTFSLMHEKIKYPRMVDSVKNEIRKYIKRERRNELPEGVDFWDFDCKFGDTEAAAKVVHLKEIDTYINDVAKREQTSFYVEILRKEGVRAKPEGQRSKEQEAPVIELPKIKSFGQD